MDKARLEMGSVPVRIAARVYGRDPAWVRAGVIAGWLPIGEATRNGKRITDVQHIMHINSVLMILRQMGVGPQEGFGISDATATWSEFCQGKEDIEAVKSYTALKVRMLFDPPQSSSTMEATKNLISELEWRLYAECDREEPKCGC